MAVLFFIGAVTIAVFKVRAVILHRLTFEFADYALVHSGGEFVVLDAATGSQRRRIGRPIPQRLQRNPAALGSGIRSEQVRAAVNHVHRPALHQVTRVLRFVAQSRRAHAVEDLAHFRRSSHRSRYNRQRLASRSVCETGSICSAPCFSRAV